MSGKFSSKTKITLYLDDEDPGGARKTEKRKSDQLKDSKPPAPKMKFSLNSSSSASVKPIKLTLSKAQASVSESPVAAPPSGAAFPKKSKAVAAAFNQEDESDEEEMPAEARMKMRNLGKDTPVPSGPNSFGKSKIGFSQDYKMYERQLMKQIGDPDTQKRASTTSAVTTVPVVTKSTASSDSSNPS